MKKINAYGDYIITWEKGYPKDGWKEDEKVVTAIFKRWVQESDFLFEGRHFGLNQITSYSYQDYERLDENLIEKQVDNNRFIAVRKAINHARNKLKKVAFKYRDKER